MGQECCYDVGDRIEHSITFSFDDRKNEELLCMA
jgi:hypothetical protein